MIKNSKPALPALSTCISETQQPGVHPICPSSPIVFQPTALPSVHPAAHPFVPQETGMRAVAPLPPPFISVSSDQAKTKKLTLEDEKRCGRPLGVKFRNGRLYVLDAYHGLFELDVAGGVVGGAKHLVCTCVRVFFFFFGEMSPPAK